MKKFLSLLLAAAFLLLPLSACEKAPQNSPESTKDSLETTKEHPKIIELSPEERSALLNIYFSDTPFANVNDRDLHDLTIDEVRAIISTVPTDEYEIYPWLHTIPRSATLYKNNEMISIDPTDPRLIGLINLYNNSVYYRKYAYTQGTYTLETIQAAESEPFRLELTFETFSTPTILYDAAISYCDTFIVTNDSFYLISHTIITHNNTLFAVGHFPLGNIHPWLDLFGF